MRLESIGRLAHDVSFEINTPLQNITSNLYFLTEVFGEAFELIDCHQDLLKAIESGQANPELVEKVSNAHMASDLEGLREEIPMVVTQVKDGIDKITNVLSGIRALSPSGQNKIGVPTDLNQTIESVVGVSRSAWESVAKIDVDLEENLPLATCLAHEMGQVIFNIMVNAVHAIEDAKKETPEREGRIAISSKSDGRTIEIRIADTGAGIPDEIREYIFDPFFSAKEVDRGTDRSLAIAHSVVVKAQGGTLKFESTPAGTTFIIRMPLEPKQSDDRP